MGLALQTVWWRFCSQMAEQVFGQRLGLLLHAGAEGVLAFLADQTVRVLAVGQKHEAHMAAVFQGRQAGLQCPPGRLAPGVVAVKAEHHTVDHAEQPFHVLFAGSGAQGGDSIGHAVLGQGDNVHIALDHQNVIELAVVASGLVEAVELPALVEYRCLGGVQVLGLVVAQHPTPKTYHPATAVTNREGDAITEAVITVAAVRVLHH